MTVPLTLTTAWWSGSAGVSVIPCKLTVSFAFAVVSAAPSVLTVKVFVLYAGYPLNIWSQNQKSDSGSMKGYVAMSLSSSACTVSKKVICSTGSGPSSYVYCIEVPLP